MLKRHSFLTLYGLVKMKCSNILSFKISADNTTNKTVYVKMRLHTLGILYGLEPLLKL